MMGVPADSGVSKVIWSMPVVVVVMASTLWKLGAVGDVLCCPDAPVTFVMLPVATVTMLSNAQLWPVLLVSHVHQMCQWPPVLYSMKTPTPSPGAAFIVWFGSTSTSMGCVDPPPELLPEPLLLPEPPTDA